MRRSKPYPVYKGSGIEWVSKIPENWHITKLKYLVAQCQNGTWGSDPLGDETDTLCIRVADFDRNSFKVIDNPETYRQISSEHQLSRSLSKGDILLEKSGGGEKTPVGANVQYVGNKNAVCSNFVAAIKSSEKSDSTWLNYLMSTLYAYRINVRSIKQATGIQNLDSEQYLSEWVMCPSLQDQIRISAKIEKEVTHFNSLILKKIKFIDLLKEKRESLITHVVTKGLEPNVKMKDSGVGWIGLIPAHWQQYRIATLFQEVSRIGSTDLPILSISIHDGITDKEVDPEDRVRQTQQIEDRTKYKRVLKGDIAYNMMRAWQGAFGAVKVEGLVSPAYVVARPKRDFKTPYIEYLLRTPMAVEEMRRFSRGIADFRMRLYWEYFRDVRICLPPIDEQAEILAHIERETLRIDQLINKTQRSIELLEERRSAFIIAAVTGQIDLREGVK